MSTRLFMLFVLLWVAVGTYVYLNIPSVRNIKIDPIITTKEVIKEVVKEVPVIVPRCTREEVSKELEIVLTEVVQHDVFKVRIAGKLYEYHLVNKGD